MRKLTIQIDGMSCGHCIDAVRKALSGAPGVHPDEVEIGRADVSYDEKVTGPAEIESAVAEAGYPATAVAP